MDDTHVNHTTFFRSLKMLLRVDTRNGAEVEIVKHMTDTEQAEAIAD